MRRRRPTLAEGKTEAARTACADACGQAAGAITPSTSDPAGSGSERRWRSPGGARPGVDPAGRRSVRRNCGQLRGRKRPRVRVQQRGPGRRETAGLRTVRGMVDRGLAQIDLDRLRPAPAAQHEGNTAVCLNGHPSRGKNCAQDESEQRKHHPGRQQIAALSGPGQCTEHVDQLSAREGQDNAALVAGQPCGAAGRAARLNPCRPIGGLMPACALRLRRASASPASACG
jgi:hypothetical protein